MTGQVRGKILVVDDTTATRYIAVRLLKNAGHEVLEAATAADGIALARQAQPHVILLDVKLPDMVGYEATQLLKSGADTSHIPILQISASYTSADARAFGLDRGADAYLTLPIEAQVLIATVNALLRLYRAERALQETVRARDEFLSIASHDLRAPLTSIQLTVELALRSARKSGEGSGESKLAPHLERISGQSKRLTQMLENLLDISQISAGTVALQPEPVDLAALTREAIERFSEQIENPEAKMTLHAPEPVVGHWDRIRLEQVVCNLISNAIKYGNGTPIELGVEHDEQRARLTVRDHGVGISPEQQARIFQRFQRGQRGRESGSYGLGLWIVQRIVDAFGGRISVESALGEGSTFTVELPLSEADGQHDPNPRLASEPPPYS